MIEYDSRRTGNGLLDTGSTPVWSTENNVMRMPVGAVSGQRGVNYGDEKWKNKRERRSGWPDAVSQDKNGPHGRCGDGGPGADDLTDLCSECTESSDGSEPELSV